ncbi:MAG: hypothetical protein RBT75_10900 [Anaerolineae bacterium]|jgi:hypothetical protein|nr:hypothetical protein [Anaerolineae bacterium]
MRNSRSNLILLIVLQVVAIILYPPEFFSRAPQAALLPPAMFLLLVLALIGMNTGTLALESGRTALNMIQGLNIVVRLIMLFPNLKRGDTWDILLILAQLVGMGLSWYNMTKLDQLPLSELRFRPEKTQ